MGRPARDELLVGARGDRVVRDGFGLDEVHHDDGHRQGSVRAGVGAVARGEGAGWIVLREMLPNVAAPVVIEATIRVAFAVMLFATLSFLGLGAQPPASEWGLMVSEARRFMHQAPWVIVAPSLAIAATAICFNLLGDGLRDALNPRDER